MSVITASAVPGAALRRPTVARSALTGRSCSSSKSQRSTVSAALAAARRPALPLRNGNRMSRPRPSLRVSASDDDTDLQPSKVQKLLYPDPQELPDDFEMPIAACFCYSKELVVFLEAPVATQGVRFLQLSPGEFFFTSLKVSGYTGILVAAPTVLYEIIAYVVPGLTRDEKKFLAPVVFGSSILFYTGILFAYEILTPAALNFFVNYADGAVESLWSIDQYFEFVLVLMLGQLRLVSSRQMINLWRYVVVGAVVAAAVLTPSTDPFTQMLLAGPLIGLYMGGAFAVKAIEAGRPAES
eukprot:CAMPEP_0177793958 /NCGR_PEP_ID=MMETSP0491_2-20121128/25373_1 /TAXON_ID=63592 /ORGANISM="Tetraselmis chuii, Strain PLY429" /LENGTH=297 /DNA_ID=CAMNT_0019316549 /DNA_START=44 /DNA_END=934 /DNA_ORIENTATION=+